MSQNRSRGRSYGPYCCLLFLMGLGFLIAGVGSGMVMNSLASISSNSPESSEALKTLGIWSAFTFGSLGLGSLGIFYYGIRTSIQWFGAILILCGVIGLAAFYTGGGTSSSGNVIWVVINFIAEATGSVVLTFSVTLGIGLLLVIVTLLVGGSNPSAEMASQNQSTYRSQMVVCSRCGHENPVWAAVCGKCGTQVILGNSNTPNIYD